MSLLLCALNLFYKIHICSDFTAIEYFQFWFYAVDFTNCLQFRALEQGSQQH